jgi:hypothetical protein
MFFSASENILQDMDVFGIYVIAHVGVVFLPWRQTWANSTIKAQAPFILHWKIIKKEHKNPSKAFLALASFI